MEMGVRVKPTKGSSQKVGLNFFIYGKPRWIGGCLRSMKNGIPYEYGSVRLDNSGIFRIEEVNQIDVFNVAGVTGWPNIDWCESRNPMTIHTNIMGTLNLHNVFHNYGLSLVNFITSYIF
eukprot:Gb_21292 [translate_table: standard]